MIDWPRFSGAHSVAEIERQPLSAWIDANTVPEVLSDSAQRYGNAVAHRFLATPDGVPFDQTYADIERAANRFAAAFAGAGVRPVVASLLPGLPETIPLLLGAMRAGISMPINPFLEPEAIIHMLERTGASILLAEGPAGRQGVYEKLGPIASALPDLEIVLCGEDRQAGDGYLMLEDWVGARAASALPAPPQPDDIAAYFHTGGTTGLPKIARLTHFNLAYMIRLTAFAGDLRPGGLLPCGMPLFHVGGLIFGGLAPLVAGTTVLQLAREGFRNREMTAQFWPLARKYDADILNAPPTVALAVMETFAPPAPVHVRHWVSSAAPLAASTHRKFTQTTGIAIKEAWGLTEATLVLTFMPAMGESRPGSAGIRLPFCQIGIVSLADAARMAEPGEPGIVMARSPGIFAGYLGMEGDGLEDAPALGPGRWLNTGDIGYLDEDGYLFLTGRAKDMILRGGHNIDPASIEEAFSALPEVADCAAIALPDARVGELPVCYVTLAPGAKGDAETLRERACANIAERAAHPKFIYIMEKLPQTPVGKIDKVALRCDAAGRAVASLFPAAEITVVTERSGQISVALDPPQENAEAILSSLGLRLQNNTEMQP